MRAYLVALLLAVTASSHADEAMFAEQPTPHGILYAVHKKGTTSPTLYAYGTIHVGKQDVTPFSHAVLEALSHSKRLALEADVSRAMEYAPLMLKTGRLAAGDTLDKHLTPKLVTQLHTLLGKLKMDDRVIEPLRPWAAAMSLELVAATRAGLDGSYAADAFLGAWATTHKVPIVELEGFPAQLKMMEELPDADQVQMVDDIVKQLDKPDPGKELAALYDSWKSGNEKKIETLLEKDRDKSPASKLFQQHFIDDRNVGMADKAEDLLKQEGDTFLAVGTAHIVGKKGVVALLKKRGYDVAPLK